MARAMALPHRPAWGRATRISQEPTGRTVPYASPAHVARLGDDIISSASGRVSQFVHLSVFLSHITPLLPMLGLEGGPPQLVDRAGVHDVRHLDVLVLAVTLPLHGDLEARYGPQVGGAHVRGVAEVGRLADLGPVNPGSPGLGFLVSHAGTEQVDPELSSHGGGRESVTVTSPGSIAGPASR